MVIAVFVGTGCRRVARSLRRRSSTTHRHALEDSVATEEEDAPTDSRTKFHEFNCLVVAPPSKVVPPAAVGAIKLPSLGQKFNRTPKFLLDSIPSVGFVVVGSAAFDDLVVDDSISSKDDRPKQPPRDDLELLGGVIDAAPSPPPPPLPSTWLPSPSRRKIAWFGLALSMLDHSVSVTCTFQRLLRWSLTQQLRDCAAGSWMPRSVTGQMLRL